MPRPARHEERTRLTLELSAPVRQRLEELREQTQADSLTEVVRRALAIYDAVQSRPRDSRIILRDADGRERELLVI